MLLDQVARTSEAVAGTSGRLAKIGALAEVLAQMTPDELPVGVAHLSGVLPQGSIGVGYASLRSLPEPVPKRPSLQLLEVDAALSRIAASTGPGSQGVRREEIHALFARATDRERRFLFGLLLGELRQGALAGVMVEAVARAAAVPVADVRRALMLTGDLGVVAREAVAGGKDGLGAFRLEVLRPLQPMLAQTAEGVEEALGRIRPAGIEWKLDGARIQVHRKGSEVRAFTRNLADVTHRSPDVVEAVRALPVTSVILDGEAIALRRDRRPHPFQVTMGRFGSELDVEHLRRTVPLSVFFFDILHLDGRDLIDLPAAERWGQLEAALPPELLVNRMVTAEVTEAERFLREAIERGHEGVMVKALDAPYEAGRRGAGWLKVKQAHTLDLVVLAAEWGHGRRKGWLSNLHLGARDPATGGFVMLGKTFKGMTDQMLAWQTERFQEIETHREGITVFLRPEIVVEVAFDGLQASSRYPGGLALRFARVKGYRPDKKPDDADTIDTVRAIHAAKAGDGPS